MIRICTIIVTRRHFRQCHNWMRGLSYYNETVADGQWMIRDNHTLYLWVLGKCQHLPYYRQDKFRKIRPIHCIPLHTIHCIPPGFQTKKLAGILLKCLLVGSNNSARCRMFTDEAQLDKTVCHYPVSLNGPIITSISLDLCRFQLSRFLESWNQVCRRTNYTESTHACDEYK